MRVVFIGSKDMGASALRLFQEHGANIVGVIARSDDPDPNAWHGSVTETAAELGLAVERPKDINDADTISFLRKAAPDLIFTAFHPQIYSSNMLSCVDAKFLNLHFAPLPRYRGCMPGAWAIINGEKEHGVTMHHMAPGVDDGDIAFQCAVPIEAQETGFSLYRKCETAGAKLLRGVLPDILDGRIPATQQDQSQILYYPRGYPLGGVVNWGWDAIFVARYVRAMTFPPFPNPFSFVGGTKVFVNKVSIVDNQSVGELPGKVLSSAPLQVQCGRGIIEIEDHSFENARALNRVDIASVQMLGR